MVATVEVKQAVGGTDGSPTEQPASGDISALRFHTADQYNPTDTTKPIPIPTSGYKHSFWVHIYLKLSGTFTKINNVRHSCPAIDWALGTGGELRRGNRDTGDKGCPMDTEYDVATGTVGDNGDSIEDITNGHGYYNGQTTKTVNHSGESDVVIDSTDHTGAGKCKSIVMQVRVGVGATQGEAADKTMTYKYDEI